jgi:hypothetical protein
MQREIRLGDDSMINSAPAHETAGFHSNHDRYEPSHFISTRSAPGKSEGHHAGRRSRLTAELLVEWLAEQLGQVRTA